MRVARLIQPVIRRSGAWAARQLLRTDGIRESSLDFVLLMLERHGLCFDPNITFVGEEHIPRADATRPTLIISPHSMMTTCIIRVLGDRGVHAAFVSSSQQPVRGTGRAANVLFPSGTLLLKVRKLFAENGTLTAMIDRPHPMTRIRTIPTLRGEMRVATPLLELARRCNARIVFVTACVTHEWKLVLTFAEPAQEPEVTLDDLLLQFGAFVDEHLHRAVMR
ncbi:MAG TPA: hypothetical protein VGF69_06880 [Thermoanaerobaculia bacterium]|jgi:lauroyl/myristoyl acyltransferase